MHPVFEKFLRHGRFTGKQTRGNGGKKRKKRKKRGKKEWNKRVKRDGKGQTDVKRNRTIVNPDVLSCQDVVSGADMTQMESRALTTNNREKYRTPSPPPRLYALYALKQITLESSTRRRPIKSFDLAFVRRRVVAKLSPIYTTRPPRFASLRKRSAAQLSPNNRKLIRAPLLLTSVKKNIKKFPNYYSRIEYDYNSPKWNGTLEKSVSRPLLPSRRDKCPISKNRTEKTRDLIPLLIPFESNVNNLGIDFRGNSAGLRKLRGPLLRIGVHRRA